MKFRNLGTDLIKFSWAPKSFHPNNIPELRLYLSKIYTAVSGAFLCAAGKTLISPDGMTVSRTESLAKSLKCRQDENWATLYQNHFGSQCATERVYRYLPAKVRLKKSHFGKPPLTECVLRHPPCQSELAEAPTVLCDPPRADKNDQSNRATVCQNNDAGPPASQQYTPRAK